jgi:putative membrane protein
LPKVFRFCQYFGGKEQKSWQYAIILLFLHDKYSRYKTLMILSQSISSVGRYTLFMARVFSKPNRWKVFWKRTAFEISKLGVDSIPLVIIISLFIGSVITIQMELNTSSPLIPAYSVGLATRDIVLLEFSNSILCLILAGKVGSNIASEIGTMRVTEQIDALEIMGVNSANFLVLPKVVAFIFFMPVLVAFCIFTSMLGGFLVAMFTDIIPVSRYIYGIQAMFTEWYVWYGFIKSLFFAYVIASVSSYFGYYVKGGALEVGKASTNAVVSSSILILLLDVILTKLLLQ